MCAAKIEIRGARLGSEQSKSNAIQAVSVGEDGAWLGHIQQILAANKCTNVPTERKQVVKHVQGKACCARPKPGAKKHKCSC
jgi:hypothetical protein